MVTKSGAKPQAEPRAPAKRATLAETVEYVNMMYYGDPGSGKTTSAAGLARLGEIVYVDAESGLKAGPLGRLGIPTDNIGVHRVISFEALENLYWDLKAELEEGGPEGLVLDSITETQKLLLEHIVARGVEKAERKGMERDEYAIYKEDWGVNTEQMRRLIRKVRDLPCHVALVCLSRRDQDDDGAVSVGPAVSPALQSDLMGYMDLVCHTSVEQIGEEIAYVGEFRNVGKYQAKDRYGLLPRKLVNPSFDRVIAYVNGDLTPANDEVQQAYKELRAQTREQRAADPKTKKRKVEADAD